MSPTLPPGTTRADLNPTEPSWTAVFWRHGQSHTRSFDGPGEAFYFAFRGCEEDTHSVDHILSPDGGVFLDKETLSGLVVDGPAAFNEWMTERELREAEEEARRLHLAVTDAFGMPASYRFTVEATGIQFRHGDGWITWFGLYGWTPEQEDAVKCLYKHVPQRWIGSIPDEPHFTWEQP
ncbi:hypothetical protein [Glycomyces sp. NPDC021274]|uniref:hypothetical protein n=1 Tax=Glycomyces sp. NPDC021274 TaxID=3155120 RepID=UPI003401659C